MFELLKTDSQTKARLGRLSTAHGVVATPAFMPVGTQASVKALDPRELREMGTQIILGNTYHLNIRPGLDIIRATGGLHRFMNWELPILTDSGGYQVFSLAKIRKIKPHGVEFRSHLDGSPLFLGPKEAMEIQRILGSDIAMVFDECPSTRCPGARTKAAVERTIRWARECREQPRTPGQLVFGIVQGGSNAAVARGMRPGAGGEGFRRLRHRGRERRRTGAGDDQGRRTDRTVSAGEPAALRDGPGNAGANGGVGCARRGHVRLRAANARGAQRHGDHARRHLRPQIGAYKADFRPIEEGCDCFACQHFTRAYLRHLFNVNEILGLRMVSLHNSHLYLKLMADVRAHLAAGTFADFYREFIVNYVPSQKVLTARQMEIER